MWYNKGILNEKGEIFMKLMTKELESKLPKLYETEEVSAEDKVAVVKYFTPFSNWTWYGVEYDKAKGLFFGYVEGFEKEWGYFSLAEFKEINGNKPVKTIERDLYFQPTKMSDILNK